MTNRQTFWGQTDRQGDRQTSTQKERKNDWLCWIGIFSTAYVAASLNWHHTVKIIPSLHVIIKTHGDKWKDSLPSLVHLDSQLVSFCRYKEAKEIVQETTRLLTWATNHTDSWVVSTWLHTNDENLLHNPADPGGKKDIWWVGWMSDKN